jgi:hypothetical protein
MTDVFKYAGIFFGLFVLMVGIILGTLYLALPMLRGNVATPPPGVELVLPATAEEPEPGVWGEAEIAVLSERDALQAAYDEHAETLDPELRAPVEENLGIIECAVAELSVALGDRPNDPMLKRMIVETYRNEIRLLKQALHLGRDDTLAAPPETPAR